MRAPSSGFVVPVGSAISATIAAGTSRWVRGSASAATSATSAARMRNVRWVPTSGISSSVAANVPNSEPIVESA